MRSTATDTPRHGAPSALASLDRERSSSCRRTGSSTPPRSPRCRDPKTIHDFYGFPDELFAVDYPAPGDPDLAREIADLVEPTHVGIDSDSWGIDHGAWSVLVHAFPDADIPVVQLSINATKPFEHHIELGARLAPLREEACWSLGSGNVVHNLGRIDWSQPDAGFDWARRFDDDAASIMTSRPADVASLEHHELYEMAAPTPSTSSRCCTSPASHQARTRRPTCSSTATRWARCRWCRTRSAANSSNQTARVEHHHCPG